MDSYACYAVTNRDGVLLGFQTPSTDGDHDGEFVALIRPGLLDDTVPQVTISFDAPGPLGGQHSVIPGDVEIRLPVSRFSDFDQFPDRFGVRIRREEQLLVDAEITGFKTALATIRKCVAARG